MNRFRLGLPYVLVSLVGVACSSAKSTSSGPGSGGANGAGGDHATAATNTSSSGSVGSGGASSTTSSGASSGSGVGGGDGGSACGGLGEACCGTSCSGALTCRSGTCRNVPANATGTPCSKNSECPSGICQPVGSGSVCSTTCTTTGDCIAGWTCAPETGQSGSVCQCNATAETCDGKDNDCNGVVDDEPATDQACVQQEGVGYACTGGKCVCTLMCGGQCVDLQTDPNNCGACGKACATGATCQSGNCVCPSGEMLCGGACVVAACGSCPPPDWDAWPIPNAQADVTAGAPNLESYKDNGDGTVTDNVTGLMWQQAVPTTNVSLTDALAYCCGLSLAGHGDWRLPAEAELFSIVDFGQSNPSINATYFPSTPSTDFWSSTLVAGSPSGAWYVDFGYGYTNVDPVPDASAVRCVR